MSMHTINPDSFKETTQAGEQAGPGEQPHIDDAHGKSAPVPGREGGSADIALAKGGRQTEAARRFSQDVGESLLPDAGSQEPL
ncbi:MAG: hypothetical protein V4488_24090 [Pseudomonadota bacterium]